MVTPIVSPSKLWAHGKPLITEAGCSTYQAGATRTFERGTTAHNTVEVSQRDSSEVYGQFRVGRRASSRILRFSSDEASSRLSAEHYGYWTPLRGLIHKREWLIDSQQFTLRDLLSGPLGVFGVGRLGFAPGTEVMMSGTNISVRLGDGMELQFTVFGATGLRLSGRARAAGYGTSEAQPVLDYIVATEQPVTITSSVIYA